MSRRSRSGRRDAPGRGRRDGEPRRANSRRGSGPNRPSADSRRHGPDPNRPRVALLTRRGRQWTAKPFFERGPRIPVQADRRTKDGSLGLVGPPRKGRRATARVLRTLGSPDVAADVIEALMVDRGLRRQFPRQVLAEAETEPIEVTGRRDLRDLPTFTIDPVTARDFDDAISAEDLGGGARRVWVHIADVSAYVRPGSPVDREAYRRANSVYVPGKVEPMLPEALSNHACSLIPGQDRLAVTVELELAGAKVRRAAFYRSTIRSDERLDYDRVDRIFAGEEPTAEPWGRPLATAREAARTLDEQRRESGALVLETRDSEFGFDEAGHVAGAWPTVQTESHRLIEHLMIAANEAVARRLSDAAVPTLYRVHENPDPVSVRRLADQLASLDVPTPPIPDHLTAEQAAALVGEISVLVDEHVRRTGRGRAALSSLVLRSLKQAHYTPSNLGHSGLGLTHYCHFTSPIRRYPDLVCHRALLSTLGNDEQAPVPGALEEWGVWTSEREREAMEIERDADDIARCFLLERERFTEGWTGEFEGEVVGLIPAGAFVAFGDGYEGLLPVRRLRGEWWELNEEGTILHGTRGGGTIRLGDPVRVAVGRIDPPRGRVDLYPLDIR